MELLQESRFADGRTLRIWRQITPDANGVPERVKKYMMASLGFEHFRSAVIDLSYWRLYYRTAFDNAGAIDHLYLAEVDGEFAARMWFGYSPDTGFGNFGNVYTETSFRRLGIMAQMLKFCVQDFYTSGAAMLCCSVGKEYVAAVYARQGFHAASGRIPGPMCLLKPEHGGHFSEMEKCYYDGSPIVRLRPGTAGDQFACDKFLAYTSAMRKFKHGSSGPDHFITEYRIAWQEQLCGNGITMVAENEKGTVAAWASVIRAAGQNVMTFRVHPDNMNEIGGLLQSTADAFRQNVADGPVMIYLDDRFACQLQAVEMCGRTTAGIVVPGAVAGNDLKIYTL